jgi:hypothetical protein
MPKSNSNQYWLRIAETECQKKRHLGARFLLFILLATMVSSIVIISGWALL